MIGLKICGLHPEDDLSFANDPLVTHVGIVFAQASRRYVTPADALRITACLPSSCKAVGVFVDSHPTELQQVARSTHLDIVQLHGGESPEFCRALSHTGLTVWKSIQSPRDREDQRRFVDDLLCYADVADTLLVDAPPPSNAAAGVTGGFGQAADWRYIAQPIAVAQAAFAGAHWPGIWLAGGITPENLADLLATCRPDGIDVSSGVELDGRKSVARIGALGRVVRRSGNNTGTDNSCADNSLLA